MHYLYLIVVVPYYHQVTQVILQSVWIIISDPFGTPIANWVGFYLSPPTCLAIFLLIILPMSRAHVSFIDIGLIFLFGVISGISFAAFQS